MPRQAGRLALAQSVEEVEYAAGQGGLEAIDMQSGGHARQVAQIQPELIVFYRGVAGNKGTGLRARAGAGIGSL